MRISDWSSDVCSSDLCASFAQIELVAGRIFLRPHTRHEIRLAWDDFRGIRHGRFPRLWRHGGLGRGRRLDNVGLGFTTLRIHAGVAPCWLTTLRISTPPTAHMHRNLPSCWLIPFPVLSPDTPHP